MRLFLVGVGCIGVSGSGAMILSQYDPTPDLWAIAGAGALLVLGLVFAVVVAMRGKN